MRTLGLVLFLAAAQALAQSGSIRARLVNPSSGGTAINAGGCDPTAACCLTGIQTIAGAKTFTSLITVAATGATALQLANGDNINFSTTDNNAYFRRSSTDTVQMGNTVASQFAAGSFTSGIGSGGSGFSCANSGCRFCFLGACTTRMEITNTNQINFYVAGGESFRINGANNSMGPGSTTPFHAVAPTISSGFGTSPSVTAGTATGFRVNVGTGGTATGGVLGLPTATTGWNCTARDLTSNASFVTDQTASTTTTATFANYSRTTGLLIAWTASDILAVTCVAF